MEVNDADCHESPQLSSCISELQPIYWLHGNPSIKPLASLCLCIRRLINDSAERRFEVGERVNRFWSLDLFLHSSKGSPALQKLLSMLPRIDSGTFAKPERKSVII